MMPQDALPNSQRHEDEAQDSGWTIVGSKSRQGKRGPKPRKESPDDAPPRTTDLRPVEELDADYRRIRAQFEEEDCCKRIRDIVAKNAVPGRRISRAINLGVGSFDPLDLSWAAKRSSYVQLIAFLIMIEELEKITGQKIKCIFQEPAFTQSDKDFIASLGHEVVETPAGCDMVDKDCFMYSIHLYRRIYAMAFKKHLPAIFVGTGWPAWDNILQTDGIERMEEMDRSYKRYDFPQDSHGYAFSSTSIYWKPGPGKDDEVAKPKKPEEAEPVETSTTEDEIVDRLKSTNIS